MKRAHVGKIALAVAACGACLAGPFLASIAALRLASLGGALVFSVVALAVVAVWLIARRARSRQACVPADGR